MTEGKEGVEVQRMEFCERKCQRETLHKIELWGPPDEGGRFECLECGAVLLCI